MVENLASKGGGLEIVNSELLVRDSKFLSNTASQGGVVFAIQKTLFVITTSLLEDNTADDGGIVYSMSNQVSATSTSQFIPLRDDNGELLPSLRFNMTDIKGNFSKQNLIHILLSSMIIEKSTLSDNYAIFVTHGITLISSQLWV